MLKRLLPVSAILMVFALVIVGCSDEDDNGTGIAALLKAVAVNTAPTIDGSIDAIWAQATAFNITAGESATHNNAFGEVDLMLKAVTYNDNLYVLLQWTDPSATQHNRRKEWSFANGAWSKSGDNEDRCFLMFDAGDNGSEGANCATMCHQPESGKMGTTGGGHVDVWHWKASRTNPAGFADDKWWGGTGRGSDASTVSAYSENTQDDGQGGTMPMYMHSTGTAYTGAELLEADKVAFDDQLDWTGGTIPYYVGNPAASGSRWNVKAKGVYANGVWTVEFCRALNTGNSDDVVLGSGTVQMTAAITDNSGGSHSGTEPFDLEF